MIKTITPSPKEENTDAKRNILKAMNSLRLAIQMMFSFMITDENSTLKLCKHCGKIFVASRSNVQFCSSQCKKTV